MLNHKKQVKNFMALSKGNWSEDDKNDFNTYCLGVMQNKIDSTDLMLMLKEFCYYDKKTYKKACEGLDKSKI